MPDTHSSFVWYELITSDVDAAGAFYREIVGWSALESGLPGMGYTILSAGERPVAGLMTVPSDARAAGARPGWTGYVGVADVDAAAARLTKSGGAVHRAPADIPDIGRFAVVADPQGAMFVLFTALGMPPWGPVTPGTPGHVGWHELHTSDWEAALGFYAGQFGWTKADALDMGPMGTYQTFAAGGAQIGGMMNNTGNFPRPTWLYYVNVEAIDAATARVAAKGGQLLYGPQEVPGGSWIVQAMDPQGAAFALVAPRR